MTALKWHTEKRKLSELIPYDKNPRQLSKKQHEDLTKSIKKFNLAEIPAINTDNVICAGHQRLMILKEQSNGDTEIDVRVPNRKLTQKEFQEYLIRSNKNTGEFDFEKLADFDFEDLKEYGFLEQELNFKTEITEDDYIPPETIKTDIKQGDLFQITSNGNVHRLLCGDATLKEDVKKLMNGEKADMIFTDPPYGVNYGADQELIQKKSGALSRTRTRTRIIGDDKNVKEISETLWRPSFKNLYESAKDDCSFYMTMCQGGDQMMMMMMMMMSENWQIKHELIWVKNCAVFSMGRLDYDYQHEPILFGWKKKHNWYGKGEFLKSIWQIDKPYKSELHPTMKPIELMVNAILNSSKQNDIVLDLFAGSGSTLIAAEQTNRNAYLCEIDESYCQVIIDRFTKFVPAAKIKKL